MVVNKKKMASSLILILLIVFYLYMCFNNLSFINVDFGVFITFVINGVLALWFAMSEKQAFTLGKVFYYFNFFFMVVAPMFQFLTNFKLWNYTISNNTYLVSNLLIMFWLVTYKIFYIFFFSNSSKRYKNSTNKKIPYNSSILFMLYVLTLFCFSFIVSKVSISGLFTRSTNHVSFDSGAIITIVESLCRSIPVYTLVYSYFYCKATKKSKLLLLFPLIFTILLNFPSSVARYWLGIVYIGIILVFFQKSIKNKKFDIFLICLFAILFPIFQLFKWYGINVLTDFNLLFSKFSSTYNNADFDAYSMLARGIDYVSQNGHTNGHQLLASLFFIIPRAIWSNKPVPSGQFIAESQHQFFTNLSFPLIGEGYLDFGIIGIFIFSIIFAKITSKLDFEYWNNSDKSKVINYIYPFAFGIFIFLQRGSMQPVVVYTFAFYLFIMFFSLFFKKKSGDINVQKD